MSTATKKSRKKIEAEAPLSSATSPRTPKTPNTARALRPGFGSSGSSTARRSSKKKSGKILVVIAQLFLLIVIFTIYSIFKRSKALIQHVEPLDFYAWFSSTALGRHIHDKDDYDDTYIFEDGKKLTYDEHPFRDHVNIFPIHDKKYKSKKAKMPVVHSAGDLVLEESLTCVLWRKELDVRLPLRVKSKKEQEADLIKPFVDRSASGAAAAGTMEASPRYLYLSDSVMDLGAYMASINVGINLCLVFNLTLVVSNSLSKKLEQFIIFDGEVGQVFEHVQKQYYHERKQRLNPPEVSMALDSVARAAKQLSDENPLIQALTGSVHQFGSQERIAFYRMARDLSLTMPLLHKAQYSFVRTHTKLEHDLLGHGRLSMVFLCMNEVGSAKEKKSKYFKDRENLAVLFAKIISDFEFQKVNSDDADLKIMPLHVLVIDKPVFTSHVSSGESASSSSALGSDTTHLLEKIRDTVGIPEITYQYMNSYGKEPICMREMLRAHVLVAPPVTSWGYFAAGMNRNAKLLYGVSSPRHLGSLADSVTSFVVQRDGTFPARRVLQLLEAGSHCSVGWRAEELQWKQIQEEAMRLAKEANSSRDIESGHQARKEEHELDDE